MAFVPAPGLTVGARSFSGSSVSSARRASRVASVRMTAESGSKDSPFAAVGDSLWKENVFTGGFPGGEAFFKAWAADGMSKDVPDMPSNMQSSATFKPPVEEKTGLIPKLDAMEYFKGAFVRAEPSQAPPSSMQKGVEEGAGEQAADPTTESKDVDSPPDESLYSAYFPAKVRNLAPEINIVYEKSFAKDRVYMAMTEVTASATDVYFPKEMKNKAPIIDISYNGSSLAGASVSVRMDDIGGLPTLPNPSQVGESKTSLVPGRGGGLRVEITVEGDESIKI